MTTYDAWKLKTPEWDEGDPADEQPEPETEESDDHWNERKREEKSGE